MRRYGLGKKGAPTRRRWAIGVIETDELNRLHVTGYLAPYNLMWKKQGTEARGRGQGILGFAACHPRSATPKKPRASNFHPDLKSTLTLSKKSQTCLRCICLLGLGDVRIL